MTVTEERVGFQAVARAQLPRLYALARQLAGQRAEDVVQECLTKAYQKFHDLRDIEAAPAWFRTILVNCARDRFRREASGIEETPIEEVDQISLYRRIAEEDPFPYSDSVHVDFLHSFTHHDVWQVLDRLKPKYRVPLVLVHMEGMTTQEVADLLETPLNTLLSWLHRGRKYFEAELWDYARSHGLLKRKAQRR
ncbi:MAG TPA: RNA polymerase sigma factor [Acidimicrobiia bacterium]|nr:RNA polymerase sigma factor [Acidimicrobiia bacterium]